MRLEFVFPGPVDFLYLLCFLLFFGAFRAYFVESYCTLAGDKLLMISLVAQLLVLSLDRRG